MPVSPNNQNLLNELRAAGMDATILAGIEREFDQKPATDQVVNRSILSQRSFNEYSTNKETEINKLKESVTQLEALKDSVSSGALNNNPELLKAAMSQIVKLEEFMIDEGYNENDIRNVNSKVKTDLQKALDNPNTDPNSLKTKEKENVSTNLDSTKRYVEAHELEDVMKKGLSNMGYGGMTMATHIAKALHRADKLGIDLTDDQIDALPKVIADGFESGLKPEDSIDKHFGFTAKAAANKDAEIEARVAAAELKGRTEALKENGVTIRRTSEDQGSPVLDRLRKTIRNNQNVVIDPENLPKNSKGDPEHFRVNLRGEARPLDEVARRIKHSDKAASRYATLRETMDADGMPIGTN